MEHYYIFSNYFAAETPINTNETRTDLVARLEEFVKDNSTNPFLSNFLTYRNNDNTIVLLLEETEKDTQLQIQIIKQSKLNWKEALLALIGFKRKEGGFQTIYEFHSDTPEVMNRLVSKAIWKDFMEEEVKREKAEQKARKILEGTK